MKRLKKWNVTDSLLIIHPAAGFTSTIDCASAQPSSRRPWPMNLYRKWGMPRKPDKWPQEDKSVVRRQVGHEKTKQPLEDNSVPKKTKQPREHRQWQESPSFTVKVIGSLCWIHCSCFSWVGKAPLTGALRFAFCFASAYDLSKLEVECRVEWHANVIKSVSTLASKGFIKHVSRFHARRWTLLRCYFAWGQFTLPIRRWAESVHLWPS
jgi:hypothetical protein